MKKCRSIIAVVFLFSYSMMSHATSFDCTKASTVIEKSICGNPSLGVLDDQLATTYHKAFNDSSSKDELKTQQRVWVKNIRNKCTTDDCLSSVYSSRISELNQGNINEGNLKTKISIEGNYAMQDGNNGGEVSIVAVNDNKFKFSIATAVGANTCDKNGEIKISTTNQTATFHGEESCVVTFTFSDSSLKIDTSDCTQSCGIGGYMDGVFTKVHSSVNAKKNIPDVYVNLKDYAGQHPGEGLFKDKIISPALKELLGKHYQLFINNMDNVELPEYTDGVLVASGGVPGLFTISEAILQVEKTGVICAAILDDNKILYFTNSPRYRDSLPESFVEWKSRFKDVKLINVSN